ncbi:hypothetical protein B5K11_25620 [Rhizobium leguminosarum bv. trifolii]|uniref:acyl-CoA dehydrogenase family protein n=1 Tax=Rhizobium leguminosarum TaxID=384 RepID=UPI000E2F49C2|nr:acyl-CoA dehydrogenase [Rhizobium leguminosarum]RFB88827.1 hypothetical protein B5K11_25620 [Rhizobium leguminosarum bv. trifolii]
MIEKLSYGSVEELLVEVRRFAQTYIAVHSREIDALDQMPETMIEELARRRLFAIDRLADDAPPLTHKERTVLILQIIEELGKVCPAVAKHVMDQNLGPVAMLREHGSSELKAKYLPLIQSGRRQAAFCMTEPQSGSDVRQFTTTATPTRDGVILHGKKDWITGAASRELHFVVAASPNGDGTMGLFLVDRKLLGPGAGTVTCTGKKSKLGLRGLGEYTVTLEDVLVPAENIVLPCGPGSLRKIMAQYNFKRCGQAAISVGISKSALEIGYNYLSGRYPVPNGRLAFQSAEFSCADMYSRIQAMEQLTYWAADRLAEGDDSGVPSSVAKSFSTEEAVSIASAAAQLCGANGLSDSLPIERLLRDARMLTVAGGTTETMKVTISKHLPTLLRPDVQSNHAWYQ